MKPLQSRERFRSLLEDLRLDPEHLDPWSGWKAFKEFLKQEVEGPYDAAAVQVQPVDDGTAMFFVRQFTEREDTSSDAADVLVGRLIVEFRFQGRQLAEEELWTLDYRTLEEWATVVEGGPSFQALVGRDPVYTDVYYEADSG
jgi:hypothetical protein